MQWDLIGEHESAYGEEYGNEIDKLVDMFDIFLDMRHTHLCPRSWHEVYRIEKDTLDNLADIYLGIVFWGYIVKIKGYSIVVIFGTSD